MQNTLWSIVILSIILLTNSGCSPILGPSKNPHTGENEDSPVLTIPWHFQSVDFKVGDKVYVQSTRLRLRSSPQIDIVNIENILEQNDLVEIIDPHADEIFVKVLVIKSSAETAIGHEYFLPKEYLSFAKARLDLDAQLAQKIFIIQNIATKKSRIYLRCETSIGCQHTLLATMDNVVGDNTEEKRTLLGSYKITQWFKFYQDQAGKYPSWYIPNFPIPAPLSDLSQWFSSSFMPNGKGEIRGGFGWYTAYVGPDASAQWMHGTFGWGADKKNPIQNTVSHGCTRFDNESVAYLRNLAPVGTTVVRVYAEEQNKSAPSNSEMTHWNYILTKLNVNATEHDKSDRNEVLQKQIPSQQWLEEGTYDVDHTAIAEIGNSYDIQLQKFKGHYNVETGRFESYSHPQGLSKGGYDDQILPDYLIQR